MQGTLTLRGGRKPPMRTRKPPRYVKLYVAKYIINGGKFEFTSYDRTKVDTRAAVLVENGISVVLTTRKVQVH